MRTRVGVVGRQLPLYRCRTRVISERVVVAVAAVVLVSVVVRLTSIIDRPLYMSLYYSRKTPRVLCWPRGCWANKPRPVFSYSIGAHKPMCVRWRRVPSERGTVTTRASFK